MSKILVVDDSGFARKQIIKRLPSELRDGVEQAADGEQAVAAYREHQPDLVLLDLTMPVLDGFGALDQIRSYDPKAKVIIITADIQAGARERCEKSGASGFLSKPPSSEQIQEIIDELLH